MKRIRRTFFEIPVISIPLGWLSKAVLWVMGWRLEGSVPDVPKCVTVVAPHTSYWDFPMGVFFAFALGIKGSFLGKDAIFHWPVLGWLFYEMGGIPVDRTKSHNMVDYAVGVFQERDHLMLGIAPEGTRKRVESWKTGFYRIAMGAGVPIAFAYLDYGRKVGGFGPLLYPTGDICADIAPIQDFYANVTGRHPELAGPPNIRPKDSK
jgi:1-acyl-sn-glycerol-3-phosphate acyltransferase